MNTMTIFDAVRILRESGYQQDGEFFVDKTRNYAGTMEFALMDLAQQYPDVPTVHRQDVEKLLETVGNRIDDNPPSPNLKSLELGVAMASNLPADEIRFKGDNAKRVSTFLDSCLYPVFNYQESVLQTTHPTLAELPCGPVPICQTVEAVYERAVLMGPAYTYPIEIEPRKMVEWAARFNCLVIQLEDTKTCWILPYEKIESEVWCEHLPITGSAGSVPEGLMYRIKPHPTVTVRRVVT